ncbi:conserved hypothetical protein [Frankia canadensis]|uniref:Uncharacterized protein n=1 Tax=Frankia canadensis TaxID=1836972 RepID=A0A2I2KY18_9ACTN|nr:hypothetical protein [Frankia canadensis]SNQ50564.1 conserved hypothetical protein [Frankia canadensis]SOU57854.1 conserved hypothetical protein [Frankia canadensis]
METFGAILVVLVLLLIPVIIVGGALTWSYLRCAPLRAAAAVEAARELRHRPDQPAAGGAPFSPGHGARRAA